MRALRFYGPLIKTPKLSYKFGLGFSVASTKTAWRREFRITLGLLFWLAELTLTFNTDPD